VANNSEDVLFISDIHEKIIRTMLVILISVFFITGNGNTLSQENEYWVYKANFFYYQENENVIV